MPTTADLYQPVAPATPVVQGWVDINQPEVMSVLSEMMPKDHPGWGYYKHNRTGWITAAQTDDVAQIRWKRLGWTFLEAYGSYVHTDHTSDNPYEVLFSRGGAKEMTVSQVEMHGFQYYPPVTPTCGRQLSQRHKAHGRDCYKNAKPVEFPQIAGKTYPPLPACEYGCEVSGGSGDPRWFPTLRAQIQHYMVMHEKEMTEQNQGKALASGIESALESLRTSGLIQASPSQTNKPFTCGLCDYECQDALDFVEHIQTHATMPEPEGLPEVEVEVGLDPADPMAKFA